MLRRCVRHILEELPETLDETYERSLQGIDKEKRQYAYRLFQCLVVSIRPLRVEELAEVFAIQPNMETIAGFDASWRPENAEESVPSACSTFVSIIDADGSRVVQFSHFSVKEFLTSSHTANSELASYYHILPQPAHVSLARICLSMLLQLDNRIDELSIDDYPLSSYAAKYWVTHAQFENVLTIIHEGMEHLFDSNKPHFAVWIWLYDMDDPEEYNNFFHTHPKQPDAVPLYYAALCGFYDLAKSLVVKHL